MAKQYFRKPNYDDSINKIAQINEDALRDLGFQTAKVLFLAMNNVKNAILTDDASYEIDVIYFNFISTKSNRNAIQLDIASRNTMWI